jgi:LacI family transcriptional regulator
LFFLLIGTPLETKKRATTILDIAKRAGVSPSTVSRIINGSTPVAPEKHAAVMDAIKRLNYRPNSAAQQLVRGRSGTIGVVTQHQGSPFFAEMQLGIERGMIGSSYAPVFVSGQWHLQEELDGLNRLIERQVEALIVIGGTIPDDVLQELSESMPLLCIGRNVPGVRSIAIDNFRAAHAAVSYLIQMGHESIVHITGLLSHHDAGERLNGYRQALTDAGLSIRPELIIEGDYTEASGVLAVERLFSGSSRARFSAIFAGNDQIAAGARLALYRRGVRVPQDVSLIGFDDQQWSEYMTPPLTTIRQPAYQMGYSAVQTVLSLLNDQPMDVPTFEAELVVRESVAMRQ